MEEEKRETARGGKDDKSSSSQKAVSPLPPSLGTKVYSDMNSRNCRAATLYERENEKEFSFSTGYRLSGDELGEKERKKRWRLAN